MNNSSNQSGFYLLSDSTDAFVARFALATIAKKTLDIQYYIYHSDASGQYLAYAILKAADRGVKVRILVDDINLSGRDSRMKMMSQHENIEIRIFNPLLHRDWFRNLEMVLRLKRAGRRMHNKAFICDNSAAIIGGRNIGDEYFDARHELNFVDLDLLSIGPIVSDITQSFDIYWNSHWATPIEELSTTRVVKAQLKTLRRKLKDRWHRAKNTDYFHSLQQAELTQKILSRDIPFVWAEARLFYDRPEKLCKDEPEKTTHIGPQVFPYFQQAEKSLLIASPYFVPGKAGVNWLQEKRRQQLDIKILTNSLAATDVAVVHAGYKKYRPPLLQAGIELFELKPNASPFHSKAKKWLKGSSSASLHAKYMVVDSRYVFVGSANLDPRSGRLNTEIGIMVDSGELARQATELYQRTTSEENCYRLSISENGRLIWSTHEKGRPAIYCHEPGASLARRIAVRLIALLPIESLL